MKTLKGVLAITMITLAVVAFSTSCSKDENQKPTGFGLQGEWSTAGNGSGGKIFTFEAMPKTGYTYSEGTANENGTYEYNPSTDKLSVLDTGKDGAVKETYNVQWQNSNWTSFRLVATGTTPKTKEAVYTKKN